MTPTKAMDIDSIDLTLEERIPFEIFVVESIFGSVYTIPHLPIVPHSLISYAIATEGEVHRLSSMLKVVQSQCTAIYTLSHYGLICTIQSVFSQILNNIKFRRETFDSKVIIREFYLDVVRKMDEIISMVYSAYIEEALHSRVNDIHMVSALLMSKSALAKHYNQHKSIRSSWTPSAAMGIYLTFLKRILDATILQYPHLELSLNNRFISFVSYLDDTSQSGKGFYSRLLESDIAAADDEDPLDYAGKWLSKQTNLILPLAQIVWQYDTVRSSKTVFSRLLVRLGDEEYKL